METDNYSLEWNIRTLMVSLFQVAFSEIEANIMTGAQIVNVNVNEKTFNNRKDEIADNDECAAFYKSVRDAEYNKLVDAYAREKIIKEEKERRRITSEQEKEDSSEVISTNEDITDIDECAAFYKSVRDAEYNKLVEAYAREKIIKEERERNRITREQEQIISAKEITDDDECAAFYKSVRDAEYNKLVEAYARETIIKEERERNRITRERLDRRNASIDSIKELGTSVIRETVPNKRGCIQQIVNKVFKIYQTHQGRQTVNGSILV
ncbi:Hypothetical predicted protein [Mytilus galloprovincialis]|uniref:Uncharacterized protein n=1 Tax=Mytilus galloprovincialis TaxID=29158 RepID=A0A8B6GG54_MYTGA|nr:Hypothetical predicted protein [Mytilus galloprovincialis]